MRHFVQDVIDRLPRPDSIHPQKYHQPNASVLGEIYEEHLAYTPELGWQWRTDGCWQNTCADAIARQVVAKALLTENNNLELRNITATLTLLQDYLQVPATDWDRDPDLAGLPDGRVLDIRTGEARAAKAEDRITRCLGVNLDAEAGCPLFMEKLAEWITDEDDRSLVQAFAGYSMTGRTDTHAFLLTLGTGRNGKGTLLGMMHHCLGDYAMALPQHSITGTMNQHPSWMMPLRVARLASIADLPPSGGWKAPLIKTLTGGDNINANYMRKDPIWFRPSAKIWLGSNNKPRVSGDDKALKARMMIVDFPNTFDPDVNLPAKLKQEAAGILNWMLAGAAIYYEKGLPKQNAVRADVKETYFADSDRFGDFIEAGMTAEADGFASNTQINDAWVAYQHKRTGNSNATVHTPMTELKDALVARGGAYGRKTVDKKQVRGICGFVANPLF